MKRARFVVLLVAMILCVVLPQTVSAQVTDLRATKSGADVVLTITTGSTPFGYFKSLSPKMAAGLTVLSTGNPSTSYTDAGAAADGSPLVFYQVGDTTGPTISITSPAGGSSVSATAVVVSGSQTNAASVYVNDLTASLGASTFTTSPGSTPNVPLVEGNNTITATAYDSAGNISVTQETLTKLGNNTNAPTITITLTPSDGTDPDVVYTPRPLITVNYSDSDGDGINTSRVFIYLNGTPVTPDVIDGSHATKQLAADLLPGMNFLSVSVSDNAGAASRASTLTHVFAVRGPLVQSLSAASGKVGDTITITGKGFDGTTPTNNIVYVGDTQVPPANVVSATTTSVVFTIPPGTQSGPVTVSVGSGSSNSDKLLTVILASGRTNIGGLVVDDAAVLGGNDSPVLFTDRASTAYLYQCENDGTWISRGSPFSNPTGLTLDSSGNVYVGEGTTGGSGRVARYIPGTGLSTYLTSSKLTGESSSVVYGLAATGPGSGPTLYLLDNANLKIKQVTSSLVISAINTNSGTINNPDAALLNSTPSSLYYSRGNSVGKIDLATPGTAVDFKTLYGGPRAMALASDEKLIVPRVGSSNRQVSVVDPANPSGCSGSASCYSYDLTPAATSGNYPILAASGIDSNGKGYIVVADGATNSAATSVYRMQKPYLSITQTTTGYPAFPDGMKMYADYDPTTSTETPDSQFVVLRVVTSPTTLFPAGATGTYPAQVTWSYADPLDPEGLNPNGGSWDGWGADPWQQEGSFTIQTSNSTQCTTAVIGGESRVRFHFTDWPGDNYIIRVQAKIPGFGTPGALNWDNPTNGWIAASTPVFTVWKRLHVEVDSFGAVAPEKDDDAAFDDIPDPIANAEGKTGQDALDVSLKHILAPAMVELFYDSGNSQGSIPFNEQMDYAIPVVNGTGPDDTILINERNEHRASTSNTGYWGVYLLGAYNVADGKWYDGVNYHGYSDNDPDDEVLAGVDPSNMGYPMGMTASNSGSTQPSISAIFTEGIRDLSAEHGFNFFYALNVTAWHEIGHQLHLPDYGTTDGSSGLMESSAPEVNMCLPLADLLTIRQISFPSSKN